MALPTGNYSSAHPSLIQRTCKLPQTYLLGRTAHSLASGDLLAVKNGEPDDAATRLTNNGPYASFPFGTSRCAQATPAGLTIRQRRYEVLYKVRWAELQYGEVTGYRTEEATLIADCDEPHIVLADLFEHYRGQHGLLGLEILALRPCQEKMPQPSPLLVA